MYSNESSIASACMYFTGEVMHYTTVCTLEEALYRPTPTMDIFLQCKYGAEAAESSFNFSDHLNCKL